MLRMRWITALALAGLSAAAWAKAPGFEGRVHYTVTLKAHTQEMDYACKGSKLRMDMESPHGKMAMILDLNARTMLTLMDASKSYMERRLPDTPSPKSSGEKLEPTGRTQTLLGYTCHEYRVQGGTGKEDIWATDALGSFMLAHGPSAVPAWAKELRDKGFFPLKVTRQAPQGSMVMEATKVEPMHLSETLFEAPQGYTKMQMPAGMAGGAGMNAQDLMKMSPQDRAKMLEKMRQAYGQP